MTKRIVIITGATKGLGKALSKAFAADDTSLFLLGRKKIASIVSEIRASGYEASGLTVDLSRLACLEKTIDRIFAEINPKKVKSIILINNAGVIVPISFAGRMNNKRAADNLLVNAVTPIILSNIFIKKVRSLKCRKLIVNISSGAARRPIEGWSLYCSSKAAVSMFTDCVSREQSRAKNGVRIFTYDPGVINTDMQRKIRESGKANFPLVGNFIKLYKSGSLKSAEAVAREIVSFTLKDLEK